MRAKDFLQHSRRLQREGVGHFPPPPLLRLSRHPRLLLSQNSPAAGQSAQHLTQDPPPPHTDSDCGGFSQITSPTRPTHPLTFRWGQRQGGLDNLQKHRILFGLVLPPLLGPPLLLLLHLHLVPTWFTYTWSLPGV